MTLKYISGGVCAPLGFKAAGVHCGVRKNRDQKDLALIVSEVEASAAAVYTMNYVKAAPLYVTHENLQNGKARAVIVNSGIANACVNDGMEKARAMCELAAKALGVKPDEVAVASTGVIGQSIDLRPIVEGIKKLVPALSVTGSEAASEAIMTTDTFAKEIAVSLDFGGKAVKIGGIAKGSGMINPDLATMLAFLTTDAIIKPELLYMLVRDAADKSFNRVSVDGDTSTNDMMLMMANGKSGVDIGGNSDVLNKFREGLEAVCVFLAKLLAKDGEGATKLLECKVSGAPSDDEAKKIADSVINSSLVKTAMYGEDANWGRILCSIGYAGVPIDVSLINVSLQSPNGKVEVCRAGGAVNFSEAVAGKVLSESEIVIDISLNQGDGNGVAWGCDLSYEYVRINGDYRS